MKSVAVAVVIDTYCNLGLFLSKKHDFNFFLKGLQFEEVILFQDLEPHLHCKLILYIFLEDVL